MNDNKIKLVLVDLDKTLIKEDSLRYLLSSFSSIKLATIIIFRFCRLMSKYEFAKRTHIHVVQVWKRSTTFLSWMKSQIDEEILNEVTNLKNAGYEIVILSASPNEYVSVIASELGFKGHGSFFDINNEYQYLWSQNKIDFLLQFYPQSKYIYEMAYTDHPKEIEMLKLFNKGYLVDPVTRKRNLI